MADPSINYELVKDWPRLPADFSLGSPTGIGIDRDRNILIFHRAGRKWSPTSPMPDTRITSKTILMLDPETGEILTSWGEDLFIMPHGLTVDGNDDIWVTDVGSHEVFRFSRQGRLLMRLGTARVAGCDANHFNCPTDVAVTKDGSVYISDGYGNSRVIKYSSTGQYLFEWGSKGDKEGEFNLPHAIDLDDEGNVYVADRENKRVQVFDPMGKFIRQWGHRSFGMISSVAFHREGKRGIPGKGFVAVDYASTWLGSRVTGSDIIFFDEAGHFMGKLGGHLKKEGKKCWYHNIIMDEEGNIYVTDILGDRIRKFSPGK